MNNVLDDRSLDVYFSTCTRALVSVVDLPLVMFSCAAAMIPCFYSADDTREVLFDVPLGVSNILHTAIQGGVLALGKFDTGVAKPALTEL